MDMWNTCLHHHAHECYVVFVANINFSKKCHTIKQQYCNDFKLEVVLAFILRNQTYSPYSVNVWNCFFCLLRFHDIDYNLYLVRLIRIKRQSWQFHNISNSTYKGSIIKASHWTEMNLILRDRKFYTKFIACT